MKYISTFIGSFLLLIPCIAFSQQKKADTIATPPKIERYGLRVGVDLYSLARSVYDKDFKGIEAVADYRLTKKIYAAGEIGTTDYTEDDSQLNFNTKGSYIKVGFDFNAYQNWLDMENMIYVGVRYGFSSFSQNLNSYKIYQNTNLDETSNYFDEVTVNSNTEYSGLSAHWIEVVGGVKAEIFNNVFLGFSFRLKSLLTDKKPANFDNLYIPGFNRTYEGSFGAGFNYSISYFIPLYKKQEKEKEKLTPKK